MKYFVVIAAVIVSVLASHGYTPEQIEQMKTISKECEETTHVEHEKLVHLRHKHFDDTDEHLKEYMLCCFKKMHWIDDHGHLKKDDIKTHLTKILHDIDSIKPCLDKHGSTSAATAYEVYKCMLQHLPTDHKYPL